MTHAVRTFERWAGRPPAVVRAAPGRVNLIGEHTDYNDGFVLPVAVDRVTVAAAAARADRVLRFRSLQVEDETWLPYPRGVAWALRQEGVELPGADVLVDSDVPQGAGLSSSAALEVAVAFALLDLAGRSLDPVRVARACRRGEHVVAGIPSGIMDQLVAVLGRAGAALFVDTRSLVTEAVPLELETAGVTLAVVDTCVSRALREGAYAERHRECMEAARVLGVPALRDATPGHVEKAAGALGPLLARRARHVVTENARVLRAVKLLRAGRLDELGRLLVAAHASLRDDFEVSTPELDLAVETAVAAGALGARMTGGGFGGSAIALVPAANFDRFAEEIRRGFAAAGFVRPGVFTVMPSEGAQRLGRGATGPA